MDNKQDEVLAELRTIARLLATGLTEGGQRDKIETLSSAGFSTGEIARLLGKNSKLVSAELINIKNRKRPGSPQRA